MTSSPLFMSNILPGDASEKSYFKGAKTRLFDKRTPFYEAFPHGSMIQQFLLCDIGSVCWAGMLRIHWQESLGMMCHFPTEIFKQTHYQR